MKDDQGIKQSGMLGFVTVPCGDKTIDICLHSILAVRSYKNKDTGKIQTVVELKDGPTFYIDMLREDFHKLYDQADMEARKAKGDILAHSFLQTSFYYYPAIQRVLASIASGEWRREEEEEEGEDREEEEK